MNKKTVTTALCACLIGVIGSSALAQQSVAAASDLPAAADNTTVNQRDKSQETLKSTDQPNNKVDIKLAAAVRRAIEQDKSLSTMAHNVKLVASNGIVTLRGPVRSDEEKASVGKCAEHVAGVSRVDNQLDVKAN